MDELRFEMVRWKSWVVVVCFSCSVIFFFSLLSNRYGVNWGKEYWKVFYRWIVLIVKDMIVGSFNDRVEYLIVREEDFELVVDFFCGIFGEGN